MSYFRLRCFQEKTTKIVLITLNILVGCLGVIYWGYIGMTQQILNVYREMPIFANVASQFEKLFAPQMAYFAITGIIQILVSVGVLLVLFQVLGKNHQLIMVRVLLVALTFEFAFNYVIAVSSSMMCTYYKQAFKQYIYSDGVYVETRTPQMNKIYKTIYNYYQFSIAQCVLTWIIAVPSILITLVSLVDAVINERTYAAIQTQLSNTTIVNPEKKSQIKT